VLFETSQKKETEGESGREVMEREGSHSREECKGKFVVLWQDVNRRETGEKGKRGQCW
jgi:hypothetical protein